MPHNSYSLLAMFTAMAMALFFPAAAYSFTKMRLPRKREELRSICQALRLSPNLKTCPYGLFKTYEDTSIMDYALPILFCSVYSFISVWLLFDNTFYDFVISKGGPNFLLQHVERIGSAPEAFDEQPGTYVWGSLSVILMAGLGCYVWSIQYIGRRLSALDLTPNAFFAVATRMVYASFIALAVRHLLPANITALQSIAFFIGMFPQRGMRLLQDKMVRVLGAARPRRKLPLDTIDGVDLFTKTRLSELGVDNAQNLAEANFVEMLLRTPYNPWKIMDWIAQAKLYVHAPGAMDELRSKGIRTVFDFLAVTDDRKSELYSTGTDSLAPQAVGYIRKALDKDPSVRLLAEIRTRITRIPGDKRIFPAGRPRPERPVPPGLQGRRAARLKRA